MPCPYCESEKVYFSSFYLQHLFRVAGDSPKRYCAGCKKRWVSRSHGSLKYRLYAISVLVSFFLSLFAAVYYAKLEGFFDFSKKSKAPLALASKGKAASPKGDLHEMKKREVQARQMIKHTQFVKRVERKTN